MSTSKSLSTIYRQEYLAFQNAKYRCTNPDNNSYENYGGRGIEFRFSSFAEFFAEVGSRPSPEHSIDRFPDNDGHYEKGNVRWATIHQQLNNRRAPQKRTQPEILTPLLVDLRTAAQMLSVS